MIKYFKNIIKGYKYAYLQYLKMMLLYEDHKQNEEFILNMKLKKIERKNEMLFDVSHTYI